MKSPHTPACHDHDRRSTTKCITRQKAVHLREGFLRQTSFADSWIGSRRSSMESGKWILEVIRIMQIGISLCRGSPKELRISSQYQQIRQSQVL
jgi:hypothetical protein